jgi:hypothetical protein
MKGEREAAHNPKTSKKELAQLRLTSEHNPQHKTRKEDTKKNLDVPGFWLLNEINKIIKTRLGLATH